MRVCGMRTGIRVAVSAKDRRQLDAIVADRNSPQKHVWRAQIVLLTADGCGTAEIMRNTGVSKTAVWRWQERFMTDGVAGMLRDKTRPSRIPPLEAEIAPPLVSATQAGPPGETTHWTAAAMAEVVQGISVSSVQRIWRRHRLQPHRVRRFKLSNDRQFASKRAHSAPSSWAGPAGCDPGPGSGSSRRPYLPRSRAGRQSDRALHAALPAPGVHPFPQRHRDRYPGGQADPRHRRQLCDAQASQGATVARATSTLDIPLHADLRLVAERGRGLLCQTDQAAAPTRRVPFNRRASGRHQPLPARDPRTTTPI